MTQRLRAAERAAEKSGDLKLWKKIYRAARKTNSVTASIALADSGIIEAYHVSVARAARLGSR